MKKLLLPILATFVLVAVGCKEDSGEKAGKELDKAVAKTKEGAKDAAEKTGDAIKDAGDKIKDATK